MDTLAFVDGVFDMGACDLFADSMSVGVGVGGVGVAMSDNVFNMATVTTTTQMATLMPSLMPPLPPPANYAYPSGMVSGTVSLSGSLDTVSSCSSSSSSTYASYIEGVADPCARYVLGGLHARVEQNERTQNRVSSLLTAAMAELNQAFCVTAPSLLPPPPQHAPQLAIAAPPSPSTQTAHSPSRPQPRVRAAAANKSNRSRNSKRKSQSQDQSDSEGDTEYEPEPDQDQDADGEGSVEGGRKEGKPGKPRVTPLADLHSLSVSNVAANNAELLANNADFACLLAFCATVDQDELVSDFVTREPAYLPLGPAHKNNKLPPGHRDTSKYYVVSVQLLINALQDTDPRFKRTQFTVSAALGWLCGLERSLKVSWVPNTFALRRMTKGSVQMVVVEADSWGRAIRQACEQVGNGGRDWASVAVLHKTTGTHVNQKNYNGPGSNYDPTRAAARNPECAYLYDPKDRDYRRERDDHGWLVHQRKRGRSRMPANERCTAIYEGDRLVSEPDDLYGLTTKKAFIADTPDAAAPATAAAAAHNNDEANNNSNNSGKRKKHCDPFAVSVELRF
jgi:hypothetical protein